MPKLARSELYHSKYKVHDLFPTRLMGDLFSQDAKVHLPFALQVSKDLFHPINLDFMLTL